MFCLYNGNWPRQIFIIILFFKGLFGCIIRIVCSVFTFAFKLIGNLSTF